MSKIILSLSCFGFMFWLVGGKIGYIEVTLIVISMRILQGVFINGLSEIASKLPESNHS